MKILILTIVVSFQIYNLAIAGENKVNSRNQSNQVASNTKKSKLSRKRSRQTSRQKVTRRRSSQSINNNVSTRKRVYRNVEKVGELYRLRATGTQRATCKRISIIGQTATCIESMNQRNAKVNNNKGSYSSRRKSRISRVRHK